MNIERIGIVVIAVRDWDAALSWYTSTLGLRPTERDDQGGWCQLALPGGGATIALMRVPPLDTSVRSRCWPVIEVDDLDVALDELEARGVAVDRRIHQGREYRIAACSDPEGNRLQLYQLIGS